VAGLLVLLYGQPLARIARLTRDQITCIPSRVRLLLGTTPLELPAPLDELARQLLSRRRGPLGIRINTAGAWAEQAAGSPAAYAAQVSRRGPFSTF